MNFQDYIACVRADGEDFINDQYKDYNDWDSIYDEMFVNDGVTGNSSGSYTFNTYTAKKNVEELVWGDDFINELNGMGMNLAECIKGGPESMDVIARCLALPYASSYLEKLFNELKEEEAEEEADEE